MLARTRADDELAGWLEQWGAQLQEMEARGRAIAAAMGTDPEAAIAPADEGRAGRTGARLGVAFGTVGEAIDHSPIGRLARRRTT